MIKAVIFDFDDTLSQTFEQVFILENIILSQMGRKQFTRSNLKATWGPPREEALAVRSPGIDLQVFMKLYYALAKQKAAIGELDIVPLPNLEVLQILKSQNKKTGILTSRPEQEVAHLKVAPHPLSNMIDFIYPTSLTGYRKPNGKVFDIVFRDTGIKPEQIAYVGDAPDDALAAKAAGLFFVATLESNLRDKTDFNGLGVDAFIKSLPELIDIMATLDKLSDEKNKLSSF